MMHQEPSQHSTAHDPDDPVLTKLVGDLEQLRDRSPRDAGLGRGGPRDLVERRLLALQTWAADPESTWQRSISREARMDRDRRVTALRAEHASLISNARRRLADSERLLGRPGRLRAVLAHRNDWFRAKVSTALAAAGVDVVNESTDGAHAVGVILAEQPDVALVEELLPSYRGREVVDRLQRGAPQTRLAVQVADGSTAAQFEDDGACAVFTRRLPAAEVAGRMVACAQEVIPCPQDGSDR